ncbi:MAG: hypothetical protein Kow0049_32150 [Stanieria sp.]
MAKFYSQLIEQLQAFIAAQKIFFTATAPTTGRINLSPKGLYEFKQERQTLINWAKHKGELGIEQYWQEKNQQSIDGLPTHLLTE